MRIKRFSISMLMVFVTLFAMTGCTDNQNDDLVWTNDNAVYAYVKAGFENDILADVEGAFASLRFQKVYVTQKNVNTWTPLGLLFVLDEDETENKQDFIRLLKQDKRINHATVCRDIEFETIDTRYIEKEKDIIAVGEELNLTLRGHREYYVQPFDFGGLYVKPKTNEKDTVKDFRGIALKSIKKEDDGWLYLELVEENYFNVIKAADIFSRLPEIEKVQPDKSNVFTVIPPIWQVSDETIAKIDDHYNDTAVIRGLKPGEVTVDFAGARCKIIVE